MRGILKNPTITPQISLILYMFIAAAILFSCTVSAKINITLGIVSNYCSIQNLSYIGSLVLDYNTTFTNTIDAYGLSGYVYFNDIAFLAAVNAINSRSDMSLWVNIKRFSDCGNKWYPAVEQFSGNSGGWASSIMVQDIWDKHKDVVAVVADEYSTTARGPSQALSYYQIPYCSSASSAPGFSDKNKNPYFWRPLPGVGIGAHVYQLLKAWKVSRIALIIQKDDEQGLGSAKDLVKALQTHGIIIISVIRLSSKLNTFSYNYVYNMLTQSNARYIFVCGQGSFIAPVLYNVGKLGIWGSNYVWMTDNSPKPYYGNPIEMYGSDYYKYIQGVVKFTPTSVPRTVPYVQQFYDTLNSLSNTWFSYSHGTGASYDCVMMMLSGFEKLLKENPTFSAERLAARGLQDLMNFKLFRNLSYAGISANPATLTENGDLEVGYATQIFTGDSMNVIDFGSTSKDGTQFIPSPIKNPIFAGNSSAIPSDGFKSIPKRVDTLNTSNGQIILGLAITGLSICMAAFVFVVYFRKRKVVKRAILMDVLLILLGFTFSYGSLIFYLNQSSTYTCIGRIVAITLGYIFVITPLVVKNAYMIALFGIQYELTKDAGVRMRSRFYALRVLVIGIDCVLLILWAQRVEVKASQIFTPTYTTYVCQDVGINGSVPAMTAALYIYNGLVFLSLWPVIYNLKHVNMGELNESSILSLLGLLILVFFGLIEGIRVFSLDDLDSGLKTCLCLWILITSLLMAVMGPKILEIYTESKFQMSRLSFPKLVLSANGRRGPHGFETNSGKTRKQSIPLRASVARTLPGPSNAGKENDYQRRRSSVSDNYSVDGSGFMYKQIITETAKSFVCQYRRKSHASEKWIKSAIFLQKIKGRGLWISLTSLDRMFAFYISSDCLPENVELRVNISAIECSPRKEKLTIEFGSKKDVSEFVASFSEAMKALVKE